MIPGIIFIRIIMDQSHSNAWHKHLSMESMKKYFRDGLYHKLRHDQFNRVSLIGRQDADRITFANIFSQMFNIQSFDCGFIGLSVKLSRRIACFLGLAICDALGASTQFLPFFKEGYGFIKKGFEDIRKAIQQQLLDDRAGEIGIWTDDCSMALCMAYSLFYNEYQMVPRHMRYLFVLWIAHGLNNGGRVRSIGLGGNIKISLEEFENKQEDYAAVKDRFNNGNGSLMRLAPIPIAFSHDIAKAVDLSAKSSRTTHNGEQAEECCKLLATILVRLINRPEDQHGKDVLHEVCNGFTSKCKSVQCLARSQVEPENLYQQSCHKYGHKFKKFNLHLEDRNWNWKDPKWTYSLTRYNDQPGYVGSYCMDAMAMALHTIWFTNSFQQVALKNANMGGDCDTVGAIAGQIAGAIYGLTDQMFQLYSEMQDFKQRKFEIFLVAFKLAHQK